ncbi:MAG: phosphopantothenoylcysteine decarboxylase [Verrucomicrobia bacterium]|nr:phosphopantothenoylcysteine decarboxylase [Verrucomicrobiota bacterium]
MAGGIDIRSIHSGFRSPFAFTVFTTPAPTPIPAPSLLFPPPSSAKVTTLGSPRPSSVICHPSSAIFSPPSLSLRCLITAGPTREFFDPVRFVSNPSTGKMGFALAAAAKEAGWSVDLVAGPVSLPEPAGVMVYPVVTAAEMHRQADALFGPCDVLIMTAAVSDWRPKTTEPQKLKKDGQGMTVELEPVPDIVSALAEERRTDQFLVGFAAETENVEAHALDKLERKGLDLIAANSVAGRDGAFGSDENKLIVLGRNGFREVLGPASKAVVARQLIDVIARLVAARPTP